MIHTGPLGRRRPTQWGWGGGGVLRARMPESRANGHVLGDRGTAQMLLNLKKLGKIRRQKTVIFLENRTSAVLIGPLTSRNPAEE